MTSPAKHALEKRDALSASQVEGTLGASGTPAARVRCHAPLTANMNFCNTVCNTVCNF